MQRLFFDYPKYAATLEHWVHLSYALALMNIDERFLQKYPTYDAMIEEGVMTTEEKILLGRVKTDINDMHSWWAPLTWFNELLWNLHASENVPNFHQIQLMNITHAFQVYYDQVCRLIDNHSETMPFMIQQCMLLLVDFFFLVSVFMGHSGETINLGSLYNLFLCTIFYGLLEICNDMIQPFGVGVSSFDLVEQFETKRKLSKLILLCPRPANVADLGEQICSSSSLKNSHISFAI